MSQIRKALVIACTLASVGGVAHAEDHAVVRRISSHGKLSSSHSKELASKVSERMARAADAPPAMIDPLRAALSQALLGTPMPPDGISAAKVRLKLYAGLNEFALEAMFAPRPGAIASCQRDLQLAKKECEALVAAAGKVSLTQAKRSGGGPAPAPVAMAPMRGPQQGPQGPTNGARFGGPYRGQQAPQQQYAAPRQQAGSRFGGAAPQQQRFNNNQQQPSRFGGSPQQQPSRFGRSAPVAQQPSRFGGATAPQQSRFGGNRPVQAAPAAAPAYVAASPAQAPAAAPAPTMSAADAAARKEAYQAKREAYLARKKAEFEERRARTLGPGLSSPSSSSDSDADEAAKPAAAAAPKPAPAAAAEPEPANELDAEMKAAVGKPAEAPPAAGAGKAGLDGDFLDGLLDDPLGGTKKKK